MKFTIFGGKTGNALISDLKVRIALQNTAAAEALRAFFPSNFTTDSDGTVVYEQTVKPGTGASIPLIQKVQLESPTLDVIIYVAGGIVVLGLIALIAKLAK